MDIWQILMTPFSWLLRTFCELFNSYGIALFFFALVVKLILFPFSLKGKKSMIKMNLVSGQLKEIQARCGNDKERYNQEVQKFYAENNVNPMGGCGWSMLPILVLWPLYAIIRRPMKYMMRLTEAATTAVADALGWTALKGAEFTVGGTNELLLASMMNANNLETAKAAALATGATATSMFVINFNFFGLDLSQTPVMKVWETDLSWNSIGLFLLPIISAALALLSMVVSTKTNAMNKDQEASAAATNRSMFIVQPLISLWIGFTLPAGLCVYWISNSLLMMVQELVCGKLLKKDYEAAQAAMAEQARASKEAEKERRRQAAERKAAAIAASGKNKKVQPQSKNKGVDVSASREGIRAYARGRAYDPDRYPITPYRDPNNAVLEEAEEPVTQPSPEPEAQVELQPETPAAPAQGPAEDVAADQAQDYEEAYSEDDQEK